MDLNINCFPFRIENLLANFKNTMNDVESHEHVLKFLFNVKRNTDYATIKEHLENAWKESRILTLKAVFNLRDCRGGKGEKEAFYKCMKWFLETNTIHINYNNIHYYGSFKDLLIIYGKSKEEDFMLRYYVNVLLTDYKSEDISQAAKFAPTENCSLDKQFGYCIKLVRIFKEYKNGPVRSLKDYRKFICALRKKLGVVERSMCNQNWKGIDKNKVPRIAGRRYAKAFLRHTIAWDSKYPATKPHDFVTYYMNGGKYSVQIERIWKNFISTLKPENFNAFALIDCKNPEINCVAVTLSLIIVELSSSFRNKMFSFSGNLEVHNITSTLQEKIKQIISAIETGCIDINKVLRRFLTYMLHNNIGPQSVPETIYIFSDHMSGAYLEHEYKFINYYYNIYYYKRPRIVFWNLHCDHVSYSQIPALGNCILINGYNDNLFESFINNKQLTEETILDHVLNSPRYDRIRLTYDNI